MIELARRQSFRAMRESSWDRTGGNADNRQVGPGGTLTVADLTGPGVVTHLWFTFNSRDPLYLRKVLLQAYWDGAASPAIESPVGDFFNVGSAFAASHSCAAFSTSSRGQLQGGKMGMNAWLPMPFRKAARLEIVNQTEDDLTVYFYADWREEPVGDDLFYFHAQFKRENPPVGAASPDGLNTTGAGNYVLLDTAGEGHFVGCNFSIYNTAGGWWGEGDDMFFVDGQDFPPDLHGTGTEDYFAHAYGMQRNQAPYHGVSLWEPQAWAPPGYPAEWKGFFTQYRLHLADPVPFTKSLVMSLEHGHANDRADDLSSVAYWYLNQPEHQRYCTLPPPDDRVARCAWEPYDLQY
jgi:hypothetical protein